MIWTCDNAPNGWRCTRATGHDGPCAAVEIVDEPIWNNEFGGTTVDDMNAAWINVGALHICAIEHMMQQRRLLEAAWRLLAVMRTEIN